MTTRMYALGLTGAIMALVLSAPTAFADRPGDVEAARANARAGGPTNARDAELLDRYGALSGTTKRDWRTGQRLDRSDKFERISKRQRND